LRVAIGIFESMCPPCKHVCGRGWLGVVEMCGRKGVGLGVGGWGGWVGWGGWGGWGEWGGWVGWKRCCCVCMCEKEREIKILICNVSILACWKQQNALTQMHTHTHTCTRTNSSLTHTHTQTHTHTAMYHLFSQWCPSLERALFSSLGSAGCNIGKLCVCVGECS
jgi:hypothetical protein